MTVSVARSRGVKLTLRAYTMTLIVCASLYFLRAPGISIYIFDAVWLLGLAVLPRHFLRMPRATFLALVAFLTATLMSILYVSIDSRPSDPLQAVIILMRFTQMAICANFFYNCVRSGELAPRDFLVPALIALLIPLWGGLVLYQLQPDMAVVFNRYAGYFGNPNSMSLYIVVAASVFCALMRFKLVPRWTTYPLFMVFFATAAYSLMLTGSNSGMLLFFVVTTIAFSGSARGVVFVGLAAVALFVFVEVLPNIILPWASDLMKSEFAGWRRTGNLIVVILDGRDLDQLGSQSYRDEVKDYLFDQQFADLRRVIIGLGPGQSKNLVYIVDGFTVTIHNFYLLMFLEFGILGSACFVALAFLSFYRFHWNFAALLMFSGFLLALLATPMLYLPYFWVPLFAGLAGLTRAYRSSRTHGS